MSDDPAPAAGIIAVAGAIVSALWLALRGERSASTAQLKDDLKETKDRAARYETESVYWQRKYHELAGEVKAAAARRHSMPPGRDELPTIDAVLDLRTGEPIADRRRAIDEGLKRDLAGFPPSLPPLAGVAPTLPQRGKPR